MTDTYDRWHRWLLDGRFGGDADHRLRDLTEFFYPIRDALLRKAPLREDDTLLDVGTGDGLIAFGADDQFGADLRKRQGSRAGRVLPRAQARRADQPVRAHLFMDVQLRSRFVLRLRHRAGQRR